MPSFGEDKVRKAAVTSISLGLANQRSNSRWGLIRMPTAISSAHEWFSFPAPNKVLTPSFNVRNISFGNGYVGFRKEN